MALLTFLGSLLLTIAFFGTTITKADVTPTPSGSSSGDESALMNIWNYQIERKIKAMIKYKMQDLAVWEEVDTVESQNPGTRRYYATPPASLIPSSAACQYVAITDAYEVVYDVQLWEKDLPAAVVAGLKELTLDIREDQIHPLPFYQARVIWNNPGQQLHDLELSAAWINNLKQEQAYSFRVDAANNRSCELLADTIRRTPQQFVESIQLQFTISAAKTNSKAIEIKSQHVTSSQLVAKLKNLPGVEGDTRYLTSNDYNRMLWEISNQVLVSEVISGDYVDADDELSLKDLVAQMFQTQKENTANFDDKMWSSVFWDPLDERPDKVTSELNKVLSINQTDNRAYATTASSSSTSAKVKMILSFFAGSASASHSSASSMTTDDLSHLLEQSNVDTEIQGEKFVPKQLDLQRMNINDLTREDLFATKRLRVRQVDIGGVLQIAVGNSSSAGEAEDENRKLRQKVTDLQERLDAVDSRLSSIQGSIDVLQDTTNVTQSDVGILQKQAQNIHVDGCVDVSFNLTNFINNINHDAVLFHPFALSCPKGKLLQSVNHNVWGDFLTCC